MEAQKENTSPDVDQPEAERGADEKSGTKTESRRETSTIGFPYLSLEDAEDGAKAIYSQAGTASVSQPQAASAMNMSHMSSGFRGRLSAMKMFGLIEYDQGRIQLTDLGRSIADPVTALDSRIEAFLRVPLYDKYANDHDGHMLPKSNALEQEFQGYGVAKKQADRARQVFERSAKHAGFLKPGSARFVRPLTSTRGSPQSAEKPPTQDAGEDRLPSSGGDGGGNDQDPVIRALVSKIPPTGAPWGVEEQVMWLRMMAMAFSMAYGGKRTITIQVDPESKTFPTS